MVVNDENCLLFCLVQGQEAREKSMHDEEEQKKKKKKKKPSRIVSQLMPRVTAKIFSLLLALLI